MAEKTNTLNAQKLCIEPAAQAVDISQCLGLRQVLQPEDGFFQAPRSEVVRATHAAKQTALQRGCEPLAVQQQGDIATGAFGQFTLGVVEQSVKHRRIARRKGLVMGPLGRFEACELTLICFKRCSCQRNQDACWRAFLFIYFGAGQAEGIKLQTHPPDGFGWGRRALGQRLQHLPDACGVKRIRKMVGGPFQTCQVCRRMVKLAGLQAQRLQQLEGVTGARQKTTFVLPFLPFGVGCGVRCDAAANAATGSLAPERDGADGHVEGGMATRASAWPVPWVRR